MNTSSPFVVEMQAVSLGTFHDRSESADPPGAAVALTEGRSISCIAAPISEHRVWMCATRP
ncbi:hypothetical protein, partial [Rhodococcus wratislaviensis]|uniref:hypothetical protein n=1 Tax=Rhodococcus wratislaviensis TaxID=44752 RepID=UPI001C3F2D32